MRSEDNDLINVGIRRPERKTTGKYTAVIVPEIHVVSPPRSKIAAEDNQQIERRVTEVNEVTLIRPAVR